MPFIDPIPELKRTVARLVVERLEGWSQVNAACLIESDQARVSNLRRNKLDGFSLEQLLRFAARLKCTIGLEIMWEKRRIPRSPLMPPPVRDFRPGTAAGPGTHPRTHPHTHRSTLAPPPQTPATSIQHTKPGHLSVQGRTSCL